MCCCNKHSRRRRSDDFGLVECHLSYTWGKYFVLIDEVLNAAAAAHGDGDGVDWNSLH